MTNKIWIGACGICFGIGVMAGWILAGDPEVTEEPMAIYIRDTVSVPTVDTLVVKDTIESDPVVKYVPRRVHDTIFIAEKIREYETEKTFEDSAWVKHTFGIRDLDDILSYNQWDYKAPPQKQVVMVEKVKVYPTKTEKVVKTVAWMTAGAGIAAIYNNNK